MPRLLREMLSPYLAPDEGSGGGITPSAEVLAENGLTAEEFAALNPRDQAALTAETPDDTKAVSDEEGQRAKEAGWKAVAATPAPTTAPVATPAPTPSPSPAPAEPGATPQPTTAPVASPGPTPAPSPIEGIAAIQIPDEADTITPWRPMVTKEQVARRDELDTKINDIDDKFAEGALTKEERKEQLKPLREELQKIDGDVAADRAGQQMWRAQVEQRWEVMVNDTVASISKAAGKDITKDAEVVMALDESVKRFGKAAELLYPKKPALWRDKWALGQATAEVASANGWQVAAPVAGAPGPTAAPRAPADLSKLPPSLAGTPPAADSHIQAGEFDHLKGLGQAETEKAVALMDQATLDRYLKD